MSDTVEIERNPLTKKELAADKPTWCPGCGDFSVLALYFKLIQNRGLHHEKFATVAGIGCSSRFPYFCLLYTSPSPRDKRQSRMPSSA